MLLGLMVLAFIRRMPAVQHAHHLARTTARMARHATAIRSICTEAADEGEAAIPLVKRELSEPTKKKVAYQQRYTCAGCNCLLPPSYEVDHIVPLALGGTNGLKNLQALCVPCHTQKPCHTRSSCSLLQSDGPSRAVVFRRGWRGDCSLFSAYPFLVAKSCGI